MDPRTPSGFSNYKICQNVPPGMPNSMNFHHSQFPQHMSFPQPSYAMNFPHQQFPHQHLYPHNVQYVVVQPQYAPFSLPQQPPLPHGEIMTTPPPTLAGVMQLPSHSHAPAGVAPSSGNPHSVSGPDEQDIIGINKDENVEPDRASRRFHWAEVEDLRLISAWLSNSKLNSSKKKEVYWKSVAKLYNSSTPRDRRREAKQLKWHWYRINRKIAHFYDCWCRVKAKHGTVQFDSMELMDQTWVMCNEEAREMYLEEAKHHFAFSHFWKSLWDKPKWIGYISSLYSKRNKLSESGDNTSSSEDEDMPAKETSQQGCMTEKKEQRGKSNSSSPLWDCQEDTQFSVDPQSMLEKNHEEIAEVQLQHTDLKLELGRSNQMQINDKEKEIPTMHTEHLMSDTSRFSEFRHVTKELMADTSRLNEFQNGCAVRESMSKKKTHAQSCEIMEHAMTAKGDVRRKEINPQGCKMAKAKRKRKGDASNPSSEVQEDIKRAVDLQTMLQTDREKMSEVQLRLSKEKLELTRLQQQEAKDRKETTLYEKYTKLLMADTMSFSEFQKEEYEMAVRHLGEMLFGKDGK